MYLDDKISKEAYEEKYSELNHKLDKYEEEKLLFSENALSQKKLVIIGLLLIIPIFLFSKKINGYQRMILKRKRRI